MEPTHPFLLPRTIPTSAGVMFQKPEMSIIKNLQTEPFGFVIVRPDVDDTVTLSKLITSSQAITNQQSLTPLRGGCPELELDEYLDFSGSFLLSGGDTLVPEIVRGPNRTIEADGSVQDEISAIFRNVEWVTGAQARFLLKGNFPSTITGSVHVVNATTGTSINNMALTAGSGTLAATITMSAGSGGPTDISFQVRLTASTIMAFDVQESIALNAFSVSGTRQVLETKSLWDLLGNVAGAETCEGQYRSAERYAITGFSALLTNTTAAQYKSGSLVAAQLPGGSEHLIPIDPEQAYNFIASYNDPKTHSGQLNKGAHWFFTPEKVQDWFFRPPEDHRGERPFFVVAWSGVATNDFANMLGLKLKLRANIELLGTNVSLIKFMPSADLGRLFDLYVTLVASHNTLSENAGHESKIKKIVSSVMANPYVKSALKMALVAGQDVFLPLAIAAV